MNNLDYIRPDLSALEYWLKDNSNFELLNKLNSMTLTDNTIKSLNPYLIIMADPKKFTQFISDIQNKSISEILLSNSSLEKKTLQFINTLLNDNGENYSPEISGFLMFLAQEYQIPLICLTVILLLDFIDTDTLRNVVDFLALNQGNDGHIGLINPLKDLTLSHKELLTWKINNSLFTFLLFQNEQFLALINK
ncbi:hypothetical protein [Lacticaseibacillus paracasei]|uniref:hypothetical protein n=1 Tax=Lacticaseibacillus paracasei TaxID=1597 RepID=UPI003CF5308F